MNLNKCNKRDRKIQKRRSGHVTDSRSPFIIEEQIRKKAEKSKRKLERRLHRESEEEQ